MKDETALISLEDVTKKFLTDTVETQAVSGVSLKIHACEYVSISGPSGCGKSTLLSILGLLDAPDSGRYLFKGRQIGDISATERAKIRNLDIGFIFQSFNLIGDLTIFENVELPLTFNGKMSKAERADRVREALTGVAMMHRAAHFPSQLSGGQQQRVAVARAIVTRPSIVLADEPTGNLDSRNGDAVMALLNQLHVNGATICVVTHDPRYAAAAKRRISMFDGKVVDERARQGVEPEARLRA
jgi:putative ABC transport system ATP-binding protein